MTVSVAADRSSPPPPATAPRKRRRRAPASGASDDCFACSKRNVKCDRRRPYCSPCLEIGTECAGYKTQLTWGVGVASRGKLRGLSLPVAKSAPATKTSPRSRPRSTSTATPDFEVEKNEPRIDEKEIVVKQEREPTAFSNGYTTFDFVNMISHPSATAANPPPALAPLDWPVSMPPEQHLPHAPAMTVEPPSHPQLLRQSLQRLSTPMMRYHDDPNVPNSTANMSVYSSDNGYGSPVSQPYAADEGPYIASPIPMYRAYSPHHSPADVSPSYPISADPRGPTSCPDPYYPHSEVSSSLSSHPTIYEMNESRRLAASPAACNMSDVSYDEETNARMSTSHGSDHFHNVAPSHISRTPWNVDDDYSSTQAAVAPAAHHLPTLPPPDFLSFGLPPDISPRLHFYLNYYEKIICPITVAIDSPSNPYRQHILSLAVESESLQHAICALASCNLRMRRRQRTIEPTNWNQPAEVDCDRLNGTPKLQVSSIPASDLPSPDPLDDASVQEEYQHRSRAVSLLNQQLSDPSKAKDDSVLATLLMLCHYRMCESGIAQFKTQFAGVKKLLGMRASGVETGNWGWMETIFTFFDAVTATVNDREAQLRGSYLEMIAAPTAPASALENLAGCDGRLFRTIANLGRLNLLSQHRPVVDSLNYGIPTPRATTPLTRPRLSGQALVDFYKFHSAKFDGNGFAHTLVDNITDDDSYFASSPVVLGQDDYEARRALFWQEWKETRLQLQKWEFDPTRLVANLGPSITLAPTQIRDFGYVSEAFRYAALLYTERLASPNLPSDHLSLQNLVAQVLFYITSLAEGDSDAWGKFLLWPLFVVGSECVSELHRNIVRSRCRDIGRRGGYVNNLAGLEVLEKMWAAEGSQQHSDGEQSSSTSSEAGGDRRSSGGALSGPGGLKRGPFRWTEFMEGVDGEYNMA